MYTMVIALLTLFAWSFLCKLIEVPAAMASYRYRRSSPKQRFDLLIELFREEYPLDALTDVAFTVKHNRQG